MEINHRLYADTDSLFTFLLLTQLNCQSLVNLHWPRMDDGEIYDEDWMKLKLMSLVIRQSVNLHCA